MVDQIGSMIRFQCSQCGKKLKAEQELVGRRVKCTGCSAVETVPQQTSGSRASVGAGAPTSVSASEDESRETIRSKVVKPKSTGQALGQSAAPSSSEQSSSEQSSSEQSSSEQSSSEQVTEREFKLKANSSGLNLRWILAIGALLCLIVASVVGYTVIKRAYAYPKFAAEFESMEEVKFYRRAHVKLDQTRKRMSIMAQAFKARDLPKGDFSDQHQRLKTSIENYTNNSESLLRQAADLLAQGKTPHAKGLLVNTGKEMQELVLEIEREIGNFNKKTRR